MHKKWLFVFAFFVGITFISCSKKTVPSKTATVTVTENPTPVVKAKPTPPPVTKKVDSSTTVTTEKTEKPVVKEKPKPEFPKVITVNDQAASKSVDGRLFYDVLGHRYWKNYKDGKYYLFDKSMYNNPDFSPPK